MTSNRMHADELDITPSLVRCLIAAQFPQWAHLLLRPVLSAGTDNALYRLGNDLVVRLPRIHWAADLNRKGMLLAAETGAAPAARYSDAAGAGRTRRPLPLALGDLLVDRG